MSRMTEPRCLIRLDSIEDLFQAGFSASENGFVGVAELFLRNPLAA
jgi:hypothetical protein